MINKDYSRRVEDFKVGDYVTTFYKGIYKVVGIKGDQLEFVRVFNSKFIPIKGIKKYSCSIYWCKKITPEYFDKLIADLTNTKNIIFNSIEHE